MLTLYIDVRSVESDCINSAVCNNENNADNRTNNNCYYHRNNNLKCTRLMKRRNFRTHMTDYTEDVLRRLQDLLVLAPAESGLQQSTILTHDDQLFIFETAGLLITSGNFDADVCKIFLLYISKGMRSLFYFSVLVSFSIKEL